jgi:hypothetical protein
VNPQDYLDAMNGRNAVAVAWESKVAPAAKHKGTDLVKQVTAVARVGLDFADLPENAGRETGDLPWGEWDTFPFTIQHKGAHYARLYVEDGSVRTTYLVNGEIVDGDTFRGFLTPAAAKSKRPIGGAITVKMENLSILA